MDVIPQLDLKLSNTRWGKYSEGSLQTTPVKKRKKSLDKYFAFG
jgi:hypothetical protein